MNQICEFKQIKPKLKQVRKAKLERSKISEVLSH